MADNMEESCITMGNDGLLNLDCLEHLAQFVSLKDRINFAQVSKLWGIAASVVSQKCTTFRYMQISLKSFSKSTAEKLNFREFVNIFKFVAPSLKSAKFKCSQYRTSIISVQFGHFKYIVTSVKVEEFKQFLKIFQQTKTIEKLVLDSLYDVPMDDWAKFFHANNLLTTLKMNFYSEAEQDNFFRYQISVLPSNLKSIRLHLWDNYSRDTLSSIIELIRKQTQLSAFHLKLVSQLLPLDVAAELLKHAPNLNALCLRHPTYLYSAIDDYNSKVVSFIPSCTNLTKLNLAGFTLTKSWCKKIVENCQSISCLKIDKCEFSKKSIEILLSLPNLNTLHLRVMKFKLGKLIPNLKRFVIRDTFEVFDDNGHDYGDDSGDDFGDDSDDDSHEYEGSDSYSDDYDYENEDEDEDRVEYYGKRIGCKILANACHMLKLTPKLSSLYFKVTEKDPYNDLDESNAEDIIRTIYSRGQNIVLREMDYDAEEQLSSLKYITKRACNMPKNEEFDIMLSGKCNSLYRLLEFYINVIYG